AQHQISGVDVDNIVFNDFVGRPKTDTQGKRFVGKLLAQHAQFSCNGGRAGHAVEVLKHVVQKTKVQPRKQEHPDKNDCNLLAQAQVKCGTPEAGQGPADAFHGLELFIVVSPSDQVYRRRRGATTPALLTARLTQGQPQKQRRPPLEEQVDCQQQP